MNQAEDRISGLEGKVEDLEETGKEYENNLKTQERYIW